MQGQKKEKRKNRMLQKRLIIILSAVLIGVLSYYFVVGWFNIIPWVLLAFSVGYFSINRKDTIINGALFGYFLFITYIVVGYKGKTDNTRLIKFAGFALLFSLVGSVAGIIGSLIGNLIKKKISN